MANDLTLGAPSPMIPFGEAQRAVLAACSPLASESAALQDAVGRVVAEELIAGEDLVPFARSAMDGFAVRSGDIQRLPICLPIAAAVFAAPGAHVHAPGTATAIATGAAIPIGADCVIPIEHVDVREGAILVARAATPGTFIFPPGDDARRGDILLGRGGLVTPAGVGLLAAAGVVRVPVHRRPRVAVLCGGDELVGIDNAPKYGQVRDSNSAMITAALRAAGAIVNSPVLVRDDRDSVRMALREACDDADLVVTTGGASVGERDFMKAACDELGVTFFFRSVALRPAKPTAFGRRGATLLALLPGNPAAAFVAFHEFVAPALRALAGHAEVRLPRVCATLDGTIRGKPERHFAVFATLATGASGFIVTPLNNQCSSLTRTAVDAAGLIIIPPGLKTYEPGDRVEFDVFDWTRVTAAVSSNALEFACSAARDPFVPIRGQASGHQASSLHERAGDLAVGR